VFATEKKTVRGVDNEIHSYLHYAALQIGRSLVRSHLESLEFLIDIKSFRSHYSPGVDSFSNRNEYQEHFLGGKDGRCVRLTTLPPSCTVVMKSGNLNFLEPSGSLQACNGIALPLHLHFFTLTFVNFRCRPLQSGRPPKLKQWSKHF